MSFKNQLQEFCQKNKIALPKYETSGKRSQNNINYFTSVVTLGDQTYKSCGDCTTKKQAEQSAAEQACNAIIVEGKAVKTLACSQSDDATEAHISSKESPLPPKEPVKMGLSTSNAEDNFKNILQQTLQKFGFPIPVYETTASTVPNTSGFISRVLFIDKSFDSNGVFRSKKLAEQSAAEEALTSLDEVELMMKSKSLTIKSEPEMTHVQNQPVLGVPQGDGADEDPGLEFYKNILQEFLQQRQMELAVYESVRHPKGQGYTSKVILQHRTVELPGYYKNKKTSEQIAAKQALILLGIKDLPQIIVQRSRMKADSVMKQTMIRLKQNIVGLTPPAPPGQEPSQGFIKRSWVNTKPVSAGKQHGPPCYNSPRSDRPHPKRQKLMTLPLESVKRDYSVGEIWLEKKNHLIIGDEEMSFSLFCEHERNKRLLFCLNRSKPVELMPGHHIVQLHGDFVQQGNHLVLRADTCQDVVMPKTPNPVLVSCGVVLLLNNPDKSGNVFVLLKRYLTSSAFINVAASLAQYFRHLVRGKDFPFDVNMCALNITLWTPKELQAVAAMDESVFDMISQHVWTRNSNWLSLLHNVLPPQLVMLQGLAQTEIRRRHELGIYHHDDYYKPWELPKGNFKHRHLSTGMYIEPPSECARRELKEETGIYLNPRDISEAPHVKISQTDNLNPHKGDFAQYYLCIYDMKVAQSTGNISQVVDDDDDLLSYLPEEDVEELFGGDIKMSLEPAFDLVQKEMETETRLDKHKSESQLDVESIGSSLQQQQAKSASNFTEISEIQTDEIQTEMDANDVQMHEEPSISLPSGNTGDSCMPNLDNPVKNSHETHAEHSTDNAAYFGVVSTSQENSISHATSDAHKEMQHKDFNSESPASLLVIENDNLHEAYQMEFDGDARIHNLQDKNRRDSDDTMEMHKAPLNKMHTDTKEKRDNMESALTDNTSAPGMQDSSAPSLLIQNADDADQDLENSLSDKASPSMQSSNAAYQLIQSTSDACQSKRKESTNINTTLESPEGGVPPLPDKSFSEVSKAVLDCVPRLADIVAEKINKSVESDENVTRSVQENELASDLVEHKSDVKDTSVKTVQSDAWEDNGDNDIATEHDNKRITCNTLQKAHTGNEALVLNQTDGDRCDTDKMDTEVDDGIIQTTPGFNEQTKTDHKMKKICDSSTIAEREPTLDRATGDSSVNVCKKFGTDEIQVLTCYEPNPSKSDVPCKDEQQGSLHDETAERTMILDKAVGIASSNAHHNFGTDDIQVASCSEPNVSGDDALKTSSEDERQDSCSDQKHVKSDLLWKDVFVGSDEEGCAMGAESELDSDEDIFRDLEPIVLQGTKKRKKKEKRDGSEKKKKKHDVKKKHSTKRTLDHTPLRTHDQDHYRTVDHPHGPLDQFPNKTLEYYAHGMKFDQTGYRTLDHAPYRTHDQVPHKPLDDYNAHSTQYRTVDHVPHRTHDHVPHRTLDHSAKGSRHRHSDKTRKEERTPREKRGLKRKRSIDSEDVSDPVSSTPTHMLSRLSPAVSPFVKGGVNEECTWYEIQEARKCSPVFEKIYHTPQFQKLLISFNQEN